MVLTRQCTTHTLTTHDQSVRHREALARVAWPLDLIENRDGEVFSGNVGVALLVSDELTLPAMCPEVRGSPALVASIVSV